MTLADEESQGGTEEHEPGHRQEEGTNERHGGNWGGAPDCLSFGRGEELPTEGPGHTASSLFLGTVGTQRGPPRPGRTLTFSSKVKATRDGYSLSAMTTPARLSLRT